LLNPEKRRVAVLLKRRKREEKPCPIQFSSQLLGGKQEFSDITHWFTEPRGGANKKRGNGSGFRAYLDAKNSQKNRRLHVDQENKRLQKTMGREGSAKKAGQELVVYEKISQGDKKEREGGSPVLTYTSGKERATVLS